MRIMMGRALVYDKLTAEKCVEDASEYICLRWYARSVLLVIESVKLNCVRDNCDSFLKCRIFNVDPWGVLWVKRKIDKFIAAKCVEDASEYI